MGITWGLRRWWQNVSIIPIITIIMSRWVGVVGYLTCESCCLTVSSVIFRSISCWNSIWSRGGSFFIFNAIDLQNRSHSSSTFSWLGFFKTHSPCLLFQFISSVCWCSQCINIRMATYSFLLYVAMRILYYYLTNFVSCCHLMYHAIIVKCRMLLIFTLHLLRDNCHYAKCNT